MVKEFLFYGKKEQEVQDMSFDDFLKLIPARSRRSLKRGLTDEEKKLMAQVEKKAKNIKTHCRDMVVVPAMVGLMIHVYTGKTFVRVNIMTQMLGHRLGEFALSRKRVAHSAPGVGATKSSSAMSVR